MVKLVAWVWGTAAGKREKTRKGMWPKLEYEEVTAKSQRQRDSKAAKCLYV